MVPGTIRDNLRFTHPDATEEEIRAVLRAVRLDDKIDSLPDGLDTSLSSTEVSGGSASASPWPGPCCAPPTCCCSTRRPRRSTG